MKPVIATAKNAVSRAVGIYGKIYGKISKLNDSNILKRESDIILELRTSSQSWPTSVEELKDYLNNTPEGNHIILLITELLFIQEYKMGRISREQLNRGELPQNVINNYDYNGPNSVNINSYLYIMLHLMFDDDNGRDDDIDLTNGFTMISDKEIANLSRGYALRDITSMREEALKDEEYVKAVEIAKKQRRTRSPPRGLGKKRHISRKKLYSKKLHSKKLHGKKLRRGKSKTYKK